MTDPLGGRPAPVRSESGRVSRYRVELPKAGIVETEHGHFQATEYAERRTGLKGAYLAVRDRVLGTTLASARLREERLSKRVALAVFSSDALSSTAYATQEILLILVLAGSGAMTYSLPIALVIATILGVVVISYRQIVRAYPSGGGAYIVAHENLGVAPGLSAAAALLIDYVLTVSVSIAAAVEALVAAFPELHDNAVVVAIALVLLIMLGNLRGIRESGTAFAIPTYGFILMLGATIAAGLVRILLSSDPNIFAVGEASKDVAPAQGLTLFLILRAFSQGCTALTGVEAISNGVGAFKPPESKNASNTLVAMALILGALFLGTTLLARHFGIVFEHGDTKTVMSQVGEEIYGRNVLFFALQFFTAAILFLAANTAFNGFPLLAAILARDGYMPRVFHARGNRLVFSYGIVALTALAITLLIGFNASTTRLIPLYALGVFYGFTLAQGGMIRFWWRHQEPGWKRSLAINTFGAVATFAVMVVILVTKFADGGWMVVAAMPVITAVLWAIGRFYRTLRRSLYVSPDAALEIRPAGRSTVPHVVPVDEINLATVMALGAACERSSQVTALHVIIDPDEPSTIEERWGRQLPKIPLVIIDSPFRTMAEPISLYVDDRLREPPHEVTVLLPVIEVRHWYQRPLVNQSLKRLGGILRKRRHVNVVPFAYSPGHVSRRRRGAALEP